MRPCTQRSGERHTKTNGPGTAEERVPWTSRAGAGTAAIVCLVACAAAAAGAESAKPATDMTVTVVKVKRECFLDSLQVTGVLAPRNEILVRSDRNGMQIS